MTTNILYTVYCIFIYFAFNLYFSQETFTILFVLSNMYSLKFILDLGNGSLDIDNMSKRSSKSCSLFNHPQHIHFAQMS